MQLSGQRLSVDPAMPRLARHQGPFSKHVRRAPESAVHPEDSESKHRSQGRHFTLDCPKPRRLRYPTTLRAGPSGTSYVNVLGFLEMAQ